MLTEAQKLQKQKELEKAQKDVMESIEKATNSPEDMKELLTFLSKYSNYSIKNRILLHRQGAKAVKSYKGWQDAGYQVQKGEKALKIWTPVVIKSFVSNGKKKSLKYATKQEKNLIAQGVLPVSTWVTFNLRACVFDALQTDMPDDELPKLYANKHIDREIDTQKAQEIISSVENVINRLGVTLENPALEEWNGGFAKGYYVPSSKKIVMNLKIRIMKK
ncbi:ArdC-like ssDNA-binding domain-containing protein [Ligilactobacillus equi]|uniref:ArdC-like ssDNA-binding domain-containing protein n=1 Tax=Ligilactobacillus equi TaxID=137357 RepID=UPI00046A3E66|nr:ArdC-like ssDNA-binding domain-containing protein [Ligilactobacillus equi]